jgi:hypothetical protein
MRIATSSAHTEGDAHPCPFSSGTAFLAHKRRKSIFLLISTFLSKAFLMPKPLEGFNICLKNLGRLHGETLTVATRAENFLKKDYWRGFPRFWPRRGWMDKKPLCFRNRMIRLGLQGRPPLLSLVAAVPGAGASVSRGRLLLRPCSVRRACYLCGLCVLCG